MTGKAVRQLISLAALAACALPGAASAQELTGVLIGTVKDAQGAVIAGAAVRVESTALIGGRADTKTNEKGQLRFAALPFGDYTLTVESRGVQGVSRAGQAIALFLGTELTQMMIRMAVTESAPFRCRQGAKQRMVS